MGYMPGTNSTNASLNNGIPKPNTTVGQGPVFGSAPPITSPKRVTTVSGMINEKSGAKGQKQIEVVVSGATIKCQYGSNEDGVTLMSSGSDTVKVGKTTALTKHDKKMVPDNFGTCSVLTFIERKKWEQFGRKLNKPFPKEVKCQHDFEDEWQNPDEKSKINSVAGLNMKCYLRCKKPKGYSVNGKITIKDSGQGKDVAEIKKRLEQIFGKPNSQGQYRIPSPTGIGPDIWISFDEAKKSLKEVWGIDISLNAKDWLLKNLSPDSDLMGLVYDKYLDLGEDWLEANGSKIVSNLLNWSANTSGTNLGSAFYGASKIIPFLSKGIPFAGLAIDALTGVYGGDDSVDATNKSAMHFVAAPLGIIGGTALAGVAAPVLGTGALLVIATGAAVIGVTWVINTGIDYAYDKGKDIAKGIGDSLKSFGDWVGSCID